MARSPAEGFAIGASNVDSLETLLAIARAARATATPAFIEASASVVAVLGLANLRDIVDNLIDELGIELYLNLDHAPTVDAAVAAIDAGFELVHIDVSQDAAETSRWVRDSPVGAPAHARAGRYAGCSRLVTSASGHASGSSVASSNGFAASFTVAPAPHPCQRQVSKRR
jgi:hypothetical protein